jgi:hypothetical protein
VSATTRGAVHHADYHDRLDLAKHTGSRFTASTQMDRSSFAGGCGAAE